MKWNEAIMKRIFLKKKPDEELTHIRILQAVIESDIRLMRAVVQATNVKDLSYAISKMEERIKE